jgi:hypothetical protein
MEEELIPSEEGEVCPVSPVYRAGDTIVFKYEGNVRATVEGSEVVGGRLRLRCRAALDFEVPASQVIEVEREGE